MVMKTVAAIVSLLWMAVTLSITFVRLVVGDRQSRFRTIGEFRKGNFVLFYLSGYPLYLTAKLLGGTPVLRALSESFTACAKLAVLSFDSELLLSAGEGCPVFLAASVLCFVFSTFNTAFFGFALFCMKIVNRLRVFRLPRRKTDLFIFVGHATVGTEALRQLDKKKNSVLYYGDVDEAERKNAFVCRYLYEPDGRSLTQTVIKAAGNLEKRTVRIIIDTGSGEKNLSAATELCAMITERGLSSFSLQDKAGINVYVFTDTQSEHSYAYLVRRSRGCLHLLNSHRMLANEFVGKYPVSALIPPQYIDRRTATVDSSLKVRMILFGFGKVGRRLMFDFAENNLLVEKRADGFASHPIEYTVFDREPPQNHLELNHSAFRYKHFLESRPDEAAYFPLPEDPVPCRFETMNVENKEFFGTLHDIMTDGSPSVNLMVISIGEDLENLDLTEKLAAKMKEWRIGDTVRFFVRTRNGDIAHKIIEKNYPDGEIVPFGCMDEILHDIRNTVSERTEVMAKLRHISYTAEAKNITDERQAERTAMQMWTEQWDEVRRASNVSACRAIRMKLLLMGFDIAPADSPEADASEEFLRAYTVDDPMAIDGETADGRRRVVYPDVFPKGTLRASMANMEHARWNAYMIGAGYIPTTKEEAFTMSKGEMAEERKHRNLTTMEGLAEYERMAQEEHGFAPGDAKVIRYDYQIMDDAPYLLKRSGMKIVRAKTNEEENENGTHIEQTV